MTGSASNLISAENQSIWLATSGGGYNKMRPQGYPAFLSGEQQCRLERIRQGRMLFQGRHREYFLNEVRTQFEFPELRTPQGILRTYVANNLLKLCSIKSADLLFGEQPIFRCEDEIQQGRLDDLVKRSHVHQLLQSACLDASYEAEAFVEAIIDDGQVYLQQVPADEIFPVGERGADGQYEQYDRYRVRNIGSEDRKVWILLITHYLAGSITRELWLLDDKGQKKQALPLAAWTNGLEAVAEEDESGVAPVMMTGIQSNTITWVPSILVGGKAASDYDGGAIELQDLVNAKESQLARILAIHSDPILAAPRPGGNAGRGADRQARADYKLYYFGNKDEVPRYVVWDGQLESGQRDRDHAVNQLLIHMETSPILLGIVPGAAPESYKKARLQAFNSLSKAARKAVIWKAGVGRMLAVAQELEQTIPGVRYDRGDIAVEFRDGIPDDEGETAKTILSLRESGTLSVPGAVAMRLKDPAAVAKELTQLEEDTEAATPSAMPAGNANGGQGDKGTMQGDEQ